METEWPRIKEGPPPAGVDCLPRRIGVLAPPVGESDLGAAGQTPVLRHQFSWTRLSMSAALAYRPDRSQAALVFQIRHGAYNTETLIEFLEEFHTHFAGEKITLIWDGLPSHRSKAMKAWIATQRSWLTVEQLPGYAHDLNPVELVWGNIKSVELANLCPDTIDEADTAADAGLHRVGTSYQLCFNFLDHTGLSL